MTRSSHHTFVTVVLLAWLSVPAVASAAEIIAITPRQQQNLGISVAQPSPATALASQRLPGEIAVPAGQERVVNAPLGGLVDAVLVAPGQEVKKGQALAHISSPDLVALQRDYLQAQTQLNLVQNTAQRDAELFRDGIIAERRYLASQSHARELDASLRQLRQALRLAGMSDTAIARLQAGGEYSSGITISAPITGQVLEQMVTLGQRIDPAMPLLRIGHLEPLWLEIHAPVEVLDAVSRGMAVRIPKYQAEGRIIAIIRNINRNDQTMHVRAEITRNAARLSPGQFVEAEILATGSGDARHAVPRSAVVRNGDEAFVFVQTEAGFVPRKVGVVSEQADQAVVTGLAGTEKIAVTGTVAIKAAWLGTGGE